MLRVIYSLGLRELLDVVPIRVGTFYMTTDTNEMFIDLPHGRMQFHLLPYLNNEIKEKYYGENSIFKIKDEDSTNSGESTDFRDGYYFRYNYLSSAEYKS